MCISPFSRAGTFVHKKKNIKCALQLTLWALKLGFMAKSGFGKAPWHMNFDWYMCLEYLNIFNWHSNWKFIKSETPFMIKTCVALFPLFAPSLMNQNYEVVLIILWLFGSSFRKDCEDWAANKIKPQQITVHNYNRTTFRFWAYSDKSMNSLTDTNQINVQYTLYKHYRP